VAHTRRARPLEDLLGHRLGVAQAYAAAFEIGVIAVGAVEGAASFGLHIVGAVEGIVARIDETAGGKGEQIEVGRGIRMGLVPPLAMVAE